MLKKITKRTFLLLVALTLSLVMKASYLRNVPQKLVQPNGEIVNCFATGDEFYHWLHDEEGYTIVQSPQNGYFYYAILVNDELIPSQHVVGKISPSKVGLKPRINISSKKMNSIRTNFLNLEKLYNAKNKVVFNGSQKVNTNGTINNLVVYIRFAGESEYSTNQSTYTVKFNSSTEGTLSLHNYYNEVSYGSLNITSTFFPTNDGSTIVSYQDSHDRNYFLKYNASTNPTGYLDEDGRLLREHTLLKSAVDYVASQVSPSLDIDNDSDGKVDNVCFIVQGSAAGWSELLWPHRWSLYSQTATINGKRVYDYNFQLQNSLDVSVLCHEMFHSLGAPDLYHYEEGNPDPVGVWDLMNSDNAQHMTQYMKYKYGKWISSIPEITTSGDYSLNPVFTKDNSCYKIKSPYSGSEYFVIEYRKKEKLDAVLPNEGLLVYRINNDAAGQGNRNGPPDELYVYRPNGSLTSEGSLSEAPFSANLNKTAINDKTNPDAFLSTGGVGGLNISNISAIGSTISFHVDMVTPLTTDVAVTKIITPQSGSYLGSNEKVKVTVSNLGSSDITPGIKVNYSLNEGSIVSEDFIGTLANGATSTFEFSTPLDLSISGDFTLKVYTTLTGDLNTANDTTISVISSNPPLEYLASLVTTNVGTYTEIASGTLITADQVKDGFSLPVTFPDGFVFNYCSKEFSKFILSTNGFIKLGDENPSSRALYFTAPQTADGGIFNSTNSADNYIIAPFSHDLVPGNGGAEYRMDIAGTAPNRIVTIQFKNVRDNDANMANQYSSMNFQVKLYETSNIIEFVYGQWVESTNTSAYKTSLCGLRGKNNSNEQLLALNKGSLMAWSEMTFANSNYSTTATLNFGNGDRPAPENGRTYRLNPRQANDLSVNRIFTMGYLPVSYGTPHAISATITNYGTSTQNNVSVSLNVTGSNTFSAPSVSIPTIEPFDTVMVTFADFSPTVIGTNSITVSVPDDDLNINNSQTATQNITSNKFGYAFSTSVPESAYKGSFAAVCKYHINGSAKISSVEAMILNNSTEMTGKTTRAYVYNASGTKIGQSNVFTVTSGNLGTWVSLAITTPPQVTDADFYVGLDCSTSYFAAYETEIPTRPNTFYKIPVAGGTLVEFGNDAALMFRAVLTPTTAIKPNNASSIIIYSNSQSIFVDIPELKGTSEIAVYNIIGNQVYKNVNPSQGLNTIEENFSAGTYIVKVIVGKEVKTQKVIIK